MPEGRTIALIPARGGSKGIPGKNICNLAGKPLISYCITAALNSVVDEVWVSTDDEEIESVSKEYGAKVLKRPCDLAEDDTNSEEVLLHFTECVPNYETLVFLQCTSPLTCSEDIDGAIDVLRYNPYDSVLSVCEDAGGWLCGGYTWEYSSKGSSMGAMRTNTYHHQRQSAPTSYRENGAIYVTTQSGLTSAKSRVSGNIGLYVMPRQRSFEIDDPEDLEELDYVIKNRLKRSFGV